MADAVVVLVGQAAEEVVQEELDVRDGPAAHLHRHDRAQVPLAVLQHQPQARVALCGRRQNPLAADDVGVVAAGEDGRLAQRALGVLAGAEDVLGALEGDDAMAILGGLQH